MQRVHPARGRHLRVTARSCVLVAREQFFEFLPGVEQAAHDCADRYLHSLSDFTIGQAALDMQDERLSLGCGKSRERCVDDSSEVGTLQPGIGRRSIIGSETIGGRIAWGLRDRKSTRLNS